LKPNYPSNNETRIIASKTSKVKSNKGWLVFGIVFLILLIDQSLKFYIKLNYHYGEWHGILNNSLRLHFLENRGMAWGLEIPFFGHYGKPLLTIFRLFAAGAIIYYIRMMDKAKAHTGFIITLAMILAGALGNILDSMFYGMIFSESVAGSGLTATFLPHGGGYAGFLYGNVVDMFYCPIIRFDWPEWMPFGMAGKEFEFFSPVFNVADSAITSGVILILLFQNKFFPRKKLPKNSEPVVMGDSEFVIWPKE
jgi:signal peptidase II